ncbi:butyrophilin subfamily 2 member A1-like isoform X9 [Phalacrocorax aristotelis]|uniref:butyrophilin subfamily 2 member A1-like isoform X9 n=1 Tax=Phalacrocorax aristotelis TaxID=126867 RepID=UPI003F4B78AA
MGLSVQMRAVMFILVLVPAHHPTAGGGHDPLLVLDGYKDDGIQLKCFSERLFSEVQLLWTDDRGDNVTGTPLTTDTTTGNTSSSIILKPGSGNSMSCKIVDKLLKTSTESSVVIAENNKTTTSEQNAQKEIQKEIDELNDELAEEQERFQKEHQDLLSKIEKVQNELEFRRAHSNAVNITLDEDCKHPCLVIEDKNKVKSSTQEEIPPKAVVVATEGFSEEKHYWEVEVADKSEWELGVVCEEIRNTLRSNTINTFPKGNLLSLRFSQGEYSLTGGNGVRNYKPCNMVGVFLDQELHKLSFFDVEEKCLLVSLSVEFSGKLYPFFSPGSDGKWLVVSPVHT